MLNWDRGPSYMNAKPCDSTAWASLRLPPHCITVNNFSHIASTIVSFGNKLNTLIPIMHFQCQDMGLIIEAMASFMPRRVCGAEVTIYLASLSGILSTTAPPFFKLFKCLICQKMPWTLGNRFKLQNWTICKRSTSHIQHPEQFEKLNPLTIFPASLACLSGRSPLELYSANC